MLTSQLNIMCKSGVDVADALKGAAEECSNPILQNTLSVVYEDVAAGDSISVAMQKHTAIFGETYIVAIKAGESSGQMTEVLDRLTKLLRFEIRMRKHTQVDSDLSRDPEFRGTDGQQCFNSVRAAAICHGLRKSRKACATFDAGSAGHLRFCAKPFLIPAAGPGCRCILRVESDGSEQRQAVL